LKARTGPHKKTEARGGKRTMKEKFWVEPRREAV